jgi:hypothetical protein
MHLTVYFFGEKNTKASSPTTLSTFPLFPHGDSTPPPGLPIKATRTTTTAFANARTNARRRRRRHALTPPPPLFTPARQCQSRNAKPDLANPLQKGRDTAPELRVAVAAQIAVEEGDGERVEGVEVAVEGGGGEAGDAEEGFGDGGAPGEDVALLGFFVEEGVGAEDVGAEAVGEAKRLVSAEGED